MSNLPATIMPVGDIEKMASAMAASKLFGMKTKEEAMSLMFLAQAEGLHPAIAARDYHIIQGRPALKADAMLARFQQAQGKVEWLEYTDDRCAAKFTHPQGGSIEIDWTMDRAREAGLSGKDTWKKFPRNMLRARVISEGIRTIFPGVAVGVYTPEEVQDFDEPKAKRARNVTPGPEEPKESPLDAYLEDIHNAPTLDGLQFKFGEAWKGYEDSKARALLKSAYDKRKAELMKAETAEERKQRAIERIERQGDYGAEQCETSYASNALISKSLI